MANTSYGKSMILLLAAVAALASLATQLLVPTLPLIARDLRVGSDQAQLAISVFLIGLGAGQLVIGPLTDRIGRKPVLIGGMALFCAGCIAGALAQELPVLLAARMAQALGGAAGIVTGRVLVADLYPPEEHIARQATLMSVILISPALAPVIGGLIGELAGWRAIFVLLALVAVISSAVSLIYLPHEAARHGSLLAARGQTTGSYLLSWTFLGPTCAIAGGSAALYMFLGASPFLLAHDYALAPREVGMAMMLVAGCSIGGTRLVAPIEKRFSALIVGTSLLLTGSLCLLTCWLVDQTGFAAFLGAMSLLGLGAGISGPAGITRIMRSAPGREGTATSLAGATQMLASAASSMLLAASGPVSFGRLAMGLSLGCSVALTGAVLAKRAEATM
jgi:DHA1 family bicyclomycin/chloramphenicol resistance-like MFS transporter